MFERRTFERILIKFSLKYSFFDSNKKYLGQTHDISAQGISLLLHKKLMPHTPLQIWLKLPHNDKPTYLEGEVIWSNLIKGKIHIAGIGLETAELMVPQVINKEIT